MRLLAALLLAAALPTPAQQAGGAHELLGQLGGRAAVMQLYETPRADGSARLTGEYLILPSMQQRFLEGERSKQLGVTFLKEGNSPILYGRPADATLQGTWSAGVLKGTRYAPGGQERERFEFSETFPDMSAYSAKVQCQLEEGRYATTLAYDIESGRLKSFDWRSRVAPAGHLCGLSGLEQRPFAGGLRFVAGRCSVTLRDLGEGVRLRAENCAAFCGSEAYLEPMLIERNGTCRLLRPQAR
jgi:hypothetical protein